MSQSTINAEIVRLSNEYYRPGGLDTERWAKIAEVPDYDQVIDDFDWAGALKTYREKDSVAILDCGCGAGHFPRRLQSKVTLPTDTVFNYDTVDPSPYSLTEHRKNLQRPFNPRHSFNTTIQDFRPVPWVDRYDIIWCMHSLYTVPRAHLPKVISTLTSLLASNGRCFIYLPKKRSAYMKLFDLYLDELGHGQVQPYLTAEEVLATLATQESLVVETTDCEFDHWIDGSEAETLATYLNQICLRPDRLTFDEWQQNAAFGRYLDKIFDHERSAWRFRQELSLITFSTTATR